MASFLSIADVAARWSCGRTFVYGAIAEMEREGYLRQLHLGRVRRIALESVEQYETLHASCPEKDADRVSVATGRLVRERRQRDSPRPPVPSGGSLVAEWRKMRGAS